MFAIKNPVFPPTTVFKNNDRALVQFTYVPLTLCKISPTLEKNTRFISSCRNAQFDCLSKTTKGIFNWITTEGEKDLYSYHFGVLPNIDMQTLEITAEVVIFGSGSMQIVSVTVKCIYFMFLSPSI